MTKIYLSKFANNLLLIFLAMPLMAQNNFQSTIKNNPRSSTENMRIAFTDEQGNQSYLPISVIKGEETGPVFTIVAGIHGFEYPPIVAVQELLQEIKPEKLAGTLIVIPIANTSSFFGRSPFINPQDRVNLNNAFPGSETGTITQRIAHFITTNIIPHSDVFLDIHGGDANEDLLPFVCYYNNEQQPQQTQMAQKLSMLSGFDYVVSYPYTLKKEDPAKYAFKQAVQDGKTALSIESGRLGNVQKEAVILIKNGVYNMLKEMEMYESNIKSTKKPTQLNRQAYIKATEKGIFYSELSAGDTVKAGTVIGYTTDEFGKLLTEYKAPASGIILYKIGTPPVSKKETVMCIGYRD